MTSSDTDQQEYPDMYLEKDTILTSVLLPKLKSEYNHVETLDKQTLRINLQNKWPVLFKSAEVVKNKERLSNCPRWEEILAKGIISKCSIVSCIEPSSPKMALAGQLVIFNKVCRLDNSNTSIVLYQSC